MSRLTSPAREALRVMAYHDLGVEPAAVVAAPQITPDLREIAKLIRKGGPNAPGANIIVSWPLYLQSSDSPSAARVLLQYRMLGSKELASAVPIEAFCIAAGVSPLVIKGILVGEIVRRSGEASTIIAAVNHPRVVAKTVEMALTDEGTDDRRMLHTAVGFLPQAKGAQTIVNVQQNATAAAAAATAGAPTPESTIRKLADRFNADRGTTAPLEITQTATAGGTAIDGETFDAADDREPVLIDADSADDAPDDDDV